MSNIITFEKKIEKRSISAVETAKLIRKELKNKFPLVKFTVRKRHYCTIDIDYDDGYKYNNIEYVCDKYQGCDFDGMQDIKTYRENCIYNTDYVFVNRHIKNSTFEQINNIYAIIFNVSRLDIDNDYRHWQKVNDIISNLDFTLIKKDENNNYNNDDLKQAIIIFLQQ